MNKNITTKETIRYTNGNVNVTIEFRGDELFNIEIYSTLDNSLQCGAIYGKQGFDWLQEILMDIVSEVAERYEE